MNVLVLGATSDIARALVLKLARPGDHYALAARNQEELRVMADDVQVRTQARVTTLSLDATQLEQHREWVDKALAQTGPLDGVVVAFGYLGEQQQAEKDFAEAERIARVNYLATISLLEPLAAALEARKGGWILGLSSVAGIRGKKSNYIYGSAKAGFTTFLEGLAHRLAPAGVQVKIAKLGFVASKMTRGMTMPKWAVVSPDHAAAGLAWLLQSQFQSAYIPWRWWPIMTIIRLLPARIFNRSNL